MYTLIAGHMLAPVMDLLRGTKTMKCLKELEESQWWPRDKIFELQNQRLRQLVKHAYDNTPYYRQIFDERDMKPNDIESMEDLVKLPVLTKKLIRRNFDSLMAHGFPLKALIPSSTAGSTGEPLKFHSTRDDFYNWGTAAAQRAYRWAGYKLGDKCVLLWPSVPDKTVLEKIREKATRLLERVMLFCVYEMSAEKMLLWTRKLQEFNPEFIRGYPSSVYLLARFIEREKKYGPRPKAVITSGEQLYDYQRDLFWKVFGCETYSFYGSREVPAIASEFAEHSGYHIAAENVIVEVVDDEDRPVPVGKEGRILVTNLHNYAMPFIRFDIGDVGALSDKACPCGRVLPLLARLSGRSADLILTRSGKLISGMSLPKRWFAAMGVEQFQMVQESYEKLVVKLVLGPEYPQSHQDKLARDLKDLWRPILGEDMDIFVDFVDQIPLTREGKRRLLLSKLWEQNKPDSVGPPLECL